MTVLSAFTGMNLRRDPDTGQDIFYPVVREHTFLTKTILADGSKKSAQNMRVYIRGEYYNPSTLAQLRPLLDKWAKMPHDMVIRQKYTNSYCKGDRVERLKGLYEYTESRLFCVDIDELPLPAYIDNTDIRATAAYAVNVLSKCSKNLIPDDVGYIAQGSSSAGFGKFAKLHLWFENKLDLSFAATKKYFYEINEEDKSRYNTKSNLVDLALYSAGQPHYLAEPIFKGIKNPIKERTIQEYGGVCHIPNNVKGLFDIVDVPTAVREKHLSKLEGSLVPSTALSNKIGAIDSWDPRDSGARRIVISAYHTAYQTNFCLKELDKIVYPMISKIRPGKELNYITQGRNTATIEGYRCFSRDLKTSVLGAKIETQEASEGFYVDIAKLPPKDTVFYLKASLGTGKTTSMVNLLKNETGSFLTVTNNTALVAANAKAFGAGLYNKEQDLLELASGSLKKMSTTIHSLWKFRDYEFDIIFLDEADAIMNDLLNATIISEPRKEEIRNALISLFRKSKVIVLSDGDLSQETLEAYAQLTDGSKKFVKLVHKVDNIPSGVATEHKSINSLLGALEGSLHLNNKCLLVSDLSPRKLNGYMHTFSRIFPEKKGVVMHAQSKEDPEFTDIVNRTNDALEDMEVDYLLASPSITNGVDFNYFDEIFVVTTSSTQSPNMRFQALKRERRANKIHFYLGRVDGYNSGYAQVTTTPEGWWESSRRLFDIRKERECKIYSSTFRLYLTEAGCTIVYEDDPYDSPQNSEDKQAALEEEALAIFEGVNKPRYNLAKEKKAMINFFFEDPDYAYILEFLKNRTFEKAETLHKVIYDFWDVLSTGNPVDLMNALGGPPGYSFNRLSAIPLPAKPSFKNEARRLRETVDILKRLGLDNLEYAIDCYICYCRYMDYPIIDGLLKGIDEPIHELGVS